MQLDNTSVPLKMLCNMERTFQACMPQMLGIPKHSILNQVAVANCVTSYWGNGYRAQRGEVTKIDSTDRVTVQWVDGSESQFNVHPTERPETDSVLCFHCR